MTRLMDPDNEALHEKHKQRSELSILVFPEDLDLLQTGRKDSQVQAWCRLGEFGLEKQLSSGENISSAAANC